MGKEFQYNGKYITWRGRRDWRRCNRLEEDVEVRQTAPPVGFFRTHIHFTPNIEKLSCFIFIFFNFFIHAIEYFISESSGLIFVTRLWFSELSTTSWSRTSNATFISFMHFERLGSYIHVLKYISAPSIEPCHSVRSLSPVSSSLIADN